MEITKDIPAKTGIAHNIDAIAIYIDQKIATVDIHSSEGHHHARVDLTPILAGATDPQKAVIRGFIKAIIAEAAAIAENEVPEVLT